MDMRQSAYLLEIKENIVCNKRSRHKLLAGINSHPQKSPAFLNRRHCCMPNPYQVSI